MSKDSFAHRSEIAEILAGGLQEIKIELAKVSVTLPRIELDVRAIEAAAIANREAVESLRLELADLRRNSHPPDARRVLARDGAIVTLGGGIGGAIVKLIELFG